LGVHKLQIPAAQRDAHHLDATPLQRQDLAPDETMADLGILVDQIGDAHRSCYLYSIRADRKRNMRSRMNLIWPNASGKRASTWKSASSARSLGRPRLRIV